MPTTTQPLATLVRATVAMVILAIPLALALVNYAGSIPEGGEPWLAGDWFINYGGGFVRRGLFGELFLALAPAGEAGLWVLFGLQAGIYAVLLAYCLQVLHRTSYAWSSIALVCSPMALAFIGWDVDGGFRKEILTFLALALLAWARRPGRPPGTVIALVVVALALFVLGVFSWEASTLLLPGILYLLLARGAPHTHLDVFRRSAAAVFVVAGGTGAVLGTLLHGDAGTAAAICDAVRDAGFRGPALCGVEATGGGGIEAIGWSSERAMQDVLVSYPLYVVFLPFFVLALLPAVVSPWFRKHWLWGVAIVAGVLPLFIVVTDYGRWTHMIVMALLFCITADDPRAAEASVWNPLSTLLYVSLWSMPHHLAPDGGWPWLGLARTVVDHTRIALGSLLGMGGPGW